MYSLLLYFFFHSIFHMNACYGLLRSVRLVNIRNYAPKNDSTNNHNNIVPIYFIGKKKKIAQLLLSFSTFNELIPFRAAPIQSMKKKNRQTQSNEDQLTVAALFPLFYLYLPFFTHLHHTGALFDSLKTNCQIGNQTYRIVIQIVLRAKNKCTYCELYMTV